MKEDSLPQCVEARASVCVVNKAASCVARGVTTGGNHPTGAGVNEKRNEKRKENRITRCPLVTQPPLQLGGTLDLPEAPSRMIHREGEQDEGPSYGDWTAEEPLVAVGTGVPRQTDTDNDHIEEDNVASLDDVFADSASGFSCSGASTEATVVPKEKPRRMADLFGEIMGEAAAIKGIPMPAPPLAPMSDDMQGECFHTLSSSRRATQCPLFPPVQHLFTAAGGDPSTLKAPVRAFTDFTNVEKQITGLTDRVFVCASQSAAAVKNLALLSAALVSLSAGREPYGPEEAARCLMVSRFSSAILQLCQPRSEE
ncbi:unnamed protein product [Boreogadus saida]